MVGFSLGYQSGYDAFRRLVYEEASEQVGGEFEHTSCEESLGRALEPPRTAAVSHRSLRRGPDSYRLSALSSFCKGGGFQRLPDHEEDDPPCNRENNQEAQTTQEGLTAEPVEETMQDHCR